VDSFVVFGEIATVRPAGPVAVKVMVSVPLEAARQRRERQLRVGGVGPRGHEYRVRSGLEDEVKRERR